MNPPFLEFHEVSKRFGAVQALNQVSFSVSKGSIHAIIGENGAGKSTIVKILYGLYGASSGEIKLEGQPVSFKSPVAAKARGIGMVHQHFMLAGPLTALDHMILESASTTNWQPLNRNQWLKSLNDYSTKFNLSVPWEKPIEELSVGQQQRIEILKLLISNSNILILDEPTAVLTPQEVESFFKQLKDLKSQGKTILIITHKLKEVMALADQVTVLRRGQHILTKQVSQTNTQELGEALVGNRLPPKEERTQASQQKTALRVRELVFTQEGRDLLKKVSFDLNQSEILGIAGIEGNGQSELLKALFVPHLVKDCVGGSVELHGKELTQLNNTEVRALGVSYFPEDRLSHGAVAEMSATENYLLGQQHSPMFCKGGWVQWDKVKSEIQRSFELFEVRPQNASLPFSAFSGGNQQKMVVAREILEKPKLLIAAQPSRGVDIGAIDRIHREILKLRDQGSSVLLVSSELDELMELSDRILVFFQGQILGEFQRSEFNEKAIGAMMGGHMGPSTPALQSIPNTNTGGEKP